jgi:predicted MFS family arabinose efflux permease
MTSEELDAGVAGAGAAAQRRRGILFLCLATALVGAAMATQMGLNENFLVEEMEVGGLQRGLLETFRETCGITALGVLMLLAGLVEPLVAAVVLVVFAIGLGAYNWVPRADYFWLVVTSLIWSQGLHVWMPLPGSMAMGLAEPGQVGRRMGQVMSSGALGTGVGLAAALAATLLKAPIRPMYVVGGVAGVLAAAACLGIPRKIKTPGPRLVFRRKYGLYYLLCFLEGWRKQIFLCFAGYLLVRKYHTPVTTMVLLWIIAQGINWLISPRVGRLIDRVGERRVLVWYFIALVPVFVGYALVPSPAVLCGLFVVDSVMFVFAMALTTYVNRIAPSREHTATLSMGVAMNHAAAVTMPLLGGLLWQYADYRLVFAMGAAAAAASVMAALRVPKKEIAGMKGMKGIGETS